MTRFSRNVYLFSWICHNLNLRFPIIMFRLPNRDNRGIHYPVVEGTEQLVTDLISTREWDISAVLLIRSLMEEIFIRGGENPAIAVESREERCGLTALGVINHRILAEFRHKQVSREFRGAGGMFQKIVCWFVLRRGQGERVSRVRSSR